MAGKTKILLLGAGALGRGYLPWKLDDERHALVFIERDPAIVAELNARRSYTTYRVCAGGYQRKTVNVAAALLPGQFSQDEHGDAVACFVAVGPRNVAEAARLLAGTHIPLILCENEPAAVQAARQAVGHDAVHFAVPDVITSNTAPAELLRGDPLAITSEDGPLYVADGVSGVHGDLVLLPQQELLRLHWQPKLYLHNTPHCVAAYLGATMGRRYIHEVMQSPAAARIVEGAMQETLAMLLRQGEIPQDELVRYAEKELARFRCIPLHDPVSRVARDPQRKLEPQGRLLGAARLCLQAGVVPRHVLTGIVAALQCLAGDAGLPGLARGEPLEVLLRQNLADLQAELRALSAEPRLALPG